MPSPLDELTAPLRDRLSQIRLVACDVDGTLLDSRHQVTRRTAEAVTAARAAGLEIMLASSRAPGAMRPVLQALDGDAPAPFIASQGAVLGRYDDAVLDLIEHRPAPLEAALSVVEAAHRQAVSIGWYSLDRWLVPHVDARIEREAAITHKQPTVANLNRQRTGPDKLMLIADFGSTDRLEMIAAGAPAEVHAQFSNPNYLEVTATGVDKGSTLQAYQASRNLAGEQVLCVGDGPNDLGMFAVAGLSASPANARPQVLEAADILTASNDEDGVACLFELLTETFTQTINE